MAALQKLANIGSDPIRSEAVDREKVAGRFGAKTAEPLLRLLELKNGFYAFESALHVFSDLGTHGDMGLLEWNSPEPWRRDYDGMADGAVFFAEDVFGVQFCICEGAVATFDPETGAFETIAADMEEWARKILDDYSALTGHPLAHEWQTQHGPIPAGQRLVPVTPFVLGGEFSADNLHLVEAVKGMRYRASIAVQIRDLPDGTPITLRVIE